jgi:DNA polymerase III delta prime subunit
MEETIEFDLDTLDTYVSAAYPDLRKCINAVQQNVNEDNTLSAPVASNDSSDYKIEMVELFKKGRIKDARTLVCSKARPEEMEEIYRWLYDNLDIIAKTDEAKDQAVIVIKQGLVDHTICADSEINLASTLIKLARLQ